MDSGRGLSREYLGMMFILGGSLVMTVGLILYYLLEDYTITEVYIFFMVAMMEAVIGILTIKGVLFKNFRSRSEIDSDRWR